MLSEKPLLPSVPFRECPIQVSLGVLGKKWTMLILRDIGFLKVDRFNQIMRATPGLTPRILSLRLSQLEEAGFLRRVETDHSVRWVLTDKGEDTLPLLLGLIEFGSKWNADEVFEDKQPRRLSQLFPGLAYQKVA